MRIFTALLALTPTLAMSDNPLPPVPEGGLAIIAESNCTDNATGESGYCVMSTDRDGNIYVTFLVDGEIMFIRQVIGNGYVTIWEASPGIPL